MNICTEESGHAKRAKVDVETTTENKEPAASLVVISEGLAEFLGTTERGNDPNRSIQTCLGVHKAKTVGGG